MADYKVTVTGTEPLERALKAKSMISFDAIETKQLTQMLNRARQPGGTPVDTGELRISSAKDEHTMGYTKDYSAHVEYGHRTRDGGFVKGQRYLQKNVEAQAPIYRADLIKSIGDD